MSDIWAVGFQEQLVRGDTPPACSRGGASEWRGCHVLITSVVARERERGIERRAYHGHVRSRVPCCVCTGSAETALGGARRCSTNDPVRTRPDVGVKDTPRSLITF